MDTNIKTETSTIDDLEVTITQFPARAASRLLHKLGKGILPALGALGGIQDSPLAALGPVLGDLLGSMTEEESDDLLGKILAGTSVLWQGKMVPLSQTGMIDLVFSGRLVTMYKVAVQAVKVNFGDFIAAALGALAARSKAAALASASISEKT